MMYQAQQNKRQTSRFVSFHIEWHLALTAVVTEPVPSLHRRRIALRLYSNSDVLIETSTGTYSMPAKLNHSAMFTIELGRRLGGRGLTGLRLRRPAEPSAAT